MRTFDELFEELRITAEERRLLVWHLASMRARKTVETLLPIKRTTGSSRKVDREWEG